MNKLILSAAATTAICVSGAIVEASAQDLPIREEVEQTTAPETAQGGETSEEGEEVCRSMQITGTRFRQRICRSEAEWEAGREAMREVSMEMRRDGADRVEQRSDGNGPVSSPQ